MAMINSVLGPLDTVDLGFTLCHEHILETSAGILQVYPEFVDLEESATKAVADFRLAYREGVRTIVDVTTIDLGRDVRYLERVSPRVGGADYMCHWYLVRYPSCLLEHDPRCTCSSLYPGNPGGYRGDRHQGRDNQGRQCNRQCHA